MTASNKALYKYLSKLNTLELTDFLYRFWFKQSMIDDVHKVNYISNPVAVRLDKAFLLVDDTNNIKYTVMKIDFYIDSIYVDSQRVDMSLLKSDIRSYKMKDI
jgi:hypothetical protein